MNSWIVIVIICLIFAFAFWKLINLARDIELINCLLEIN